MEPTIARPSASGCSFLVPQMTTHVASCRSYGYTHLVHRSLRCRIIEMSRAAFAGRSRPFRRDRYQEIIDIPSCRRTL